MEARERARKILSAVKSDLGSYTEHNNNINRVFYGYKHLLFVLLNNIRLVLTPKDRPVRILLYTDSIMLANAVTLYGMITNSLVYDVPNNKSHSFVLNTALMFDVDVIVTNMNIKDTHSFGAIPILDNILSESQPYRAVPLNMERFNISSHIGGIYVLSSGTTRKEGWIFVSFDTMFKAMENYRDMKDASTPYRSSHYILFGKWEQMFAFYALLPIILIDGTIKRYTFYTGESVEKMNSILEDTNSHFREVIIHSDRMRRIWDHVLLETNKFKFVFNMNKSKFFKSIVRYLNALRLERFFTKRVKDVHIINEDFGIEAIDVFRTSNICFTSSYGAIECANFIAYKNNRLFTNHYFSNLSGGILPSTHILAINLSDFTGNGINNLTITNDNGEIVSLNDIVTFIDVADERMPYLAFLSKNINECILSDDDMPAMYSDEIAKHFKDSLLIRDLASYKKDGKTTLLIEPRRKLMDLQLISFENYVAFVKEFMVRLDTEFNIKVDNYAIISFNSLRNESGKLAKYLLM